MSRSHLVSNWIGRLLAVVAVLAMAGAARAQAPGVTPFAGVFGDGAVGTGVDAATGTARASYPITLPPARGTPQPILSLGYAHTSRAITEVGSSWSLGLPVIERRAAAGGPPLFTATDVFLLSGARLVPVCVVAGTSCFPGAGSNAIPMPHWATNWRMYRPEVDSSYTRAIAMVDVNRDGLADFIQTNPGRVYLNLLLQYQRPVKTLEHRGQTLRYIEATKEDITTANRLCHEVLGRSLDELPPQTRRLLGLIEAMVRERSGKAGIDREDYRFTRRDVRDWARWGNTQIKVHLGRLIEMEYVLAHRGRQGQGYVYELAYDGRGKDGAPFLSGLLDVTRLGRAAASVTTTSTSRGSEGDFVGVGRPPVGGRSGGGRGASKATIARENGAIRDREDANGESTRPGTTSASPSHVRERRASAEAR